MGPRRVIDALIAVGKKALQRLDVLLHRIGAFQIGTAEIQPVAFLEFFERNSAERNQVIEILAIPSLVLRLNIRRRFAAGEKEFRIPYDGLVQQFDTLQKCILRHRAKARRQTEGGFRARVKFEGRDIRGGWLLDLRFSAGESLACS